SPSGLKRSAVASPGSSVGTVGACGEEPAGRILRASWIADSAASVGSWVFCGLFAISVVASSLRTCRGRTVTFRRGRGGAPATAEQTGLTVAANPNRPPYGHPIALSVRKKPQQAGTCDHR